MITPDNPYYAQVQLLVGVLPFVATERCLALKGGTAINLFLRDMPRLSVDIDLAYVPITDRETALREINAAMGRMKKTIETESGSPAYGVRVTKIEEGAICGMVVKSGRAEIKIEVTPVLRGSVYRESERRIVERAEKAFGFAEVLSLSFEDIYAGKLVAALDRQHPRDLFDVKELMENEGISERLFRAFIVYLISHDGSLARVVNPQLKPIADMFEKQFLHMPVAPVTVEELEQARTELIASIHSKIGEKEKRFLISFKRREPEWRLLGVDHAAELPAVKWKLHNLGRMSPEAHRDAVARLERALESIR